MLEQSQYESKPTMTKAEEAALIEGTNDKDRLSINVDKENVNIYVYDGDDVVVTEKASNYTMYGGLGDDTLSGNSGMDTLYGEDGNDKLYGSGGNDALYGGLGNDRPYGGPGNDYLEGNLGEDYLNGGDGEDILEGGEGNDELYGQGGNDELIGGLGNDKLYGSAGNDVLDGGGGEDYLDGGYGNDTYIYKRGYGNDKINNAFALATDVDEIRLEGLKQRDVIFYANEQDDLIIQIKDTKETLTVLGYFKGGNYAVSNIYFADHTVLDFEAVKDSYIAVCDSTDKNNLTVAVGGSNVNVYGYEGDDVLKGITSGNYIMYGDVGNDTLIGNDGNDILNGGSGDDYLEGGSGSKTYIYGKGYGNDCINNYDTSITSDGIVLNYINLEDVMFYTNEKEDLIIEIKETSETLTVANYFSGDDYVVDKITFSDKSYLDSKDIQNIVMADVQVKNLVDTMSSLTTEQGMSWNDNVNTERESVSASNLQFWVSK